MRRTGSDSGGSIVAAAAGAAVVDIVDGVAVVVKESSGRGRAW